MRKNVLVAVATLLALVAALYVLFGPTFSGSLSEYDDNGKLIRHIKGPASPWTIAGPRALLALLPPVLFALLGLIGHRARIAPRTGVIVSAILLLAYCLVSLLSSALAPLPTNTGLYFLPAGFLMLTAAFAEDGTGVVGQEHLHESV